MIVIMMNQHHTTDHSNESTRFFELDSAHHSQTGDAWPAAGQASLLASSTLLHHGPRLLVPLVLPPPTLHPQPHPLAARGSLAPGSMHAV